MGDARVYTSAFRFQRRMYAIYDLALPVAPTHLQLGVTAVAVLVEMVALPAVGLEMNRSTAWVWIAIPLAAGWLAGQPGADQRPLVRWAAAHLAYLTVVPRTLTGLRRAGSVDRLIPQATVWTPHPRRDRPDTAGGGPVGQHPERSRIVWSCLRPAVPPADRDRKAT